MNDAPPSPAVLVVAVLVLVVAASAATVVALVAHRRRERVDRFAVRVAVSCGPLAMQSRTLAEVVAHAAEGSAPVGIWVDPVYRDPDPWRASAYR